MAAMASFHADKYRRLVNKRKALVGAYAAAPASS